MGARRPKTGRGGRNVRKRGRPPQDGLLPKMLATKASFGSPNPRKGEDVHPGGTCLREGARRGPSGGARGDDVIDKQQAPAGNVLHHVIEPACPSQALVAPQSALIARAPLCQSIAERHARDTGKLPRHRLHMVEAAPPKRSGGRGDKDDGIGLADKAAIAIRRDCLGVPRGIRHELSEKRRQAALAGVLVGSDDARERPLERCRGKAAAELLRTRRALCRATLHRQAFRTQDVSMGRTAAQAAVARVDGLDRLQAASAQQNARALAAGTARGRERLHDKVSDSCAQHKTLPHGDASVEKGFKPL